MRNGHRVFDADTHFHPTAESLDPFLDPMLAKRKDELAKSLVEFKRGWAGEALSEPYRHMYRFGRGGGWGANPPRTLGEAAPRENAERHFQTFMGRLTPTEGGSDFDVSVRVKDMDTEGTDVHLMVPGAPSGHPEPEVDIAFLRTLHRYLDHVCRQYPNRLKSLVIADARFVDESVKEIKQWARSSWASGVMVNLPLDFPIDHPDLNPIWAAVDEEGLTVVHHSFSVGYPGYRDLWDNPFIGRTASHPWGAMRMVAAFLGAGLMDRYTNLNLAVLESGFGWLPFWMKRMEDQVEYMGYTADLKHTMSEYMTGGRFFTAIVLHEGQDMVRMVNELMGDHILMFGSDYPHAESRFPDSVDIALGWNSIGEEAKRKLMWENAARCFRYAD